MFNHFSVYIQSHVDIGSSSQTFNYAIECSYEKRTNQWQGNHSVRTPAPDLCLHDDVIKWKHFPRYWPFVRGIHRWPVNSIHKGQWRGALMFSLICALNKRLSKQSWGWWLETLSRPLWRHCNEHTLFNGCRAICMLFDMIPVPSGSQWTQLMAGNSFKTSIRLSRKG